uniref:Uncharacterized protein n=1 Tax=Strongyloides venezuelensis TaxID=75913 RepID=A0A0K0FRC5_STRVS
MNITNNLSANVSTQFHASINEMNKSIQNTRWKIDFSEHGQNSNLRKGFYRVENLKVLRVSTYVDTIKIQDDKTIILHNGDEEMIMKIVKGNVKLMVKTISQENDFEELLIFANFNIIKDVIEEFILDEIHKINDFASFKEIFEVEMEISNESLKVDFFNTPNLLLLSEKNGFSQYSYVENDCPVSMKKKELPLPKNKNNENNNTLDIFNLITAIEVGMSSTSKSDIEIDMIKNFLGVDKLEVVRLLFRLSG